VATELLPDVGYRRYVMKWSHADWDARLAGLAETIAARAEPHPDDQAVLARLADQRAYVWAVEEVYLHRNERARRFIPLPFKRFGWAI